MKERKHSFYRTCIIVLIFSLVFGSFPLSLKADTNSANNETIYEFRDLAFPDGVTGFPGREVQSGWRMLEEPTERPVLGFQPTFGVNIGSSQLGMTRNFEFEVLESGFYDIQFRALVAGNGGIGELRIDGDPIGTYDFYSSDAGYVTRSIRIMALEQGTHTLTLSVVGRNPDSPEGTAGHRMTASRLILEKLDEPPVIDQLVIESGNEADAGPLFIGSETQLSTYGIGAHNETPIDLRNHTVVYESGNPEIVEVESESGWLVAKSVGETSVTASVYHQGTTITQSLPIIVQSRAGNEPIVYDFRNVGFPDQPAYTQPGWRLIGLPTDRPVLGFQPSFGVNMGTTGVGQGRSFEFNVPETGEYLLHFRAQKTTSGGIGAIKVDGRTVGEYIFYQPSGASRVTEPIHIMHLEQGNHILTLEVIGKPEEAPDNPAYRMTASEWVLEMLAELPVLSDVDLTIDDSELYVGSRAQLHVTGTTLDSISSDVFNHTITYSSGDPHIVDVDPITGELTAVGVGSATVSVTVETEDDPISSSLTVDVQSIESTKTRSTFYTDDKISAARQNIAQYEWAQNMKDTAVRKADHYVAQGLDFLWSLPTPQSLPRSFAVNQQLGSPLNGDAINQYGSYPYTYDVINEPWKVVDPTDGKKYPTNDFEAFYKSGLDAHGVFTPQLADRSLLFNEEYPDPSHPLHKWGVDDGQGWIDEDGNRYTFIAYYTHWAIWGRGGMVQDALNALSDAYLYTGDVEYARAGLVLLDRIADIYPSLDVAQFSNSSFLNSHGGTHQGKAIGSIWETFIVKDYLYAYDAFFPAMNDPELIQFLSGKAEEYELGPFKYSTTGIRKNIEDGIVLQVYPGVKEAKIRGNNGMHQSALALAAIVYDKMPETGEWLDFIFQSGELLSGPYRVTGGNMGATLVNDVDRDGHGDEASPGYNRLWLNYFLETADILNGYDLYESADLYQHPKFSKMFHALYPLLLSEDYSPQIGDTGSTGNPGIFLEKGQMAKAFSEYGDPIFAQLTYFLNNQSTIGIRDDIFAENPEQIAIDIQAIIDQHGPLQLESTNVTGYGFTGLRDGQNPKASFGAVQPFVLLPISSQTSSTIVLDSNGALQFEAEGIGERIEFLFEVETSGEYEISIKPYRTTTSLGYGEYDVQIDGQDVAELDFYGTRLDHEVISSQYLTAGTHTIAFESIGKHAESQGYKMGLFEISLLDEAAQQERDGFDDTNTLRDVWMYYGRNSGHGHRDTLNIGLHAFGLDLSPDLGYPEFTGQHPKRGQWTSNTISHNTVKVDEQKQQVQWVAEPKHYDDRDRVKLIDVEAPQVYPQTELYKRTTAMIQVDDQHSYAVDFFRVKGGEDHLFSFHGAEGEVTTEGLHLTPQVDGNGDYVGTYAGPDGVFGERPEEDSAPGSAYMGPGYHFLDQIERDQAPASQFSVDWSIKDTWNVYGEGRGADTDVHLRLTMLGELDKVTLANGYPPNNKPGNPESLRYVLAHRSGENLDSLFTSVIEPYKGERYIQSISPVTVEANGSIVDNNEVKAVKVELENGRTDYVIHALDREVTYTVDGKFEFRGFFGVYSEENGQQSYGYVQDGSLIGKANDPIVQADVNHDRITGTIADFTKALEMDNQITISANLHGLLPDELIGTSIYVENDGERNAVYEIQEVTPVGEDLYELNIGQTTLIRAYVDDHDFSQGFMYDVTEHAGFYIPLSHQQELEVSHAASVEDISTRIVELAADEAITNEQSARALTMHLTAVSLFEQQGEINKVVTHLNSFKRLVEQMKVNELLNERAHRLLLADAEAVLSIHLRSE